MKKRNIILITVIVLILIAVLVATICYLIDKEQRKYEIVEVNQYNYFVLKQNDLQGVIDKKGDTLIKPEYDQVIIPNPEKSVFIAYKGDSIKVFNEKNEEILTDFSNVEPMRFKNISSSLMYEKSVLRYEKDGKYGIINFDGKVLTKPIYNEINTLQSKEGELVVNKDGKIGVINIKGKELIKPEYDEISIDEYYTNENKYRNSGYIVGIKTEEGYRYGYINNKGKKILDMNFNKIKRVVQIEDDENAYLICAKNGKYGVIKNDKTIIENEYQSIEYDKNNKIFIIEKSKKYGVANIKGEIIVPIQYDQIDITGIYLYAKNDQGTTVYNNNGSQVNIDSNIVILNTDNEKYKIKINNKQGTKYGVINEKGEQLIEEKYNYIRYLYDNYFMVSYENGKLGVLDDDENVKIELDKDSFQQLQDTQLIQTSVSESKTVQLYSKTFEKICEMQNATVDVEDEYIRIYNDNEIKYFNKEGKELKNTEVYKNNKLFVQSNENKYGFADKEGNLVVECQYDKAYEFNEYGFAAVMKDGKWGVINEEGEQIVNPIYDLSEQSEPSFIGQYYRVLYGFGEFYYTDEK